MTVLRAMAIMTTDIRGSTVQFRMLSEVDLEALLTEHRQSCLAWPRPTTVASSRRRGMGAGWSSRA
jgi:hypothetical protein